MNAQTAIPIDTNKLKRLTIHGLAEVLDAMGMRLGTDSAGHLVAVPKEEAMPCAS